MLLTEKERRFRGVAVSEGVAIGPPFFLPNLQEEPFPEFPIALSEVDDEIARYRRALYSSRQDLQRLQTDLTQEGSEDAATIFHAHMQMLEDPLITTHMEEKIRVMQQNTESVFRSVINEYEERFSKTSDSFFQQRLIDVMDLSKRILGHLCPKQKFSFAHIPPHAIVFTRMIIPSHVAALHAAKIGALVTQMGGGNSHTALIARAKRIPYVDAIDMQDLCGIRARNVIADAVSGEIIFNPRERTLNKYKKQQAVLHARFERFEVKTSYAAETKEGVPISLQANIEHLQDIEEVHRFGAQGIGLFRTEYLFLQDASLFVSEEKQLTLYQELIERANGLPVTIRVLDIGGDKSPDIFFDLYKEPNPVLGCRGIRFLLRYPEIFRTQLKAILRAAEQGNVRILLPLVSDVEELLQVKEMMKKIQEEMEPKVSVPLGCMIEVPSAALLCEFLAMESDFLSIGTNDLVQYSLGMDRSNPIMSGRCFPAHPSVIRILKMVMQEGTKSGKPITICGEIASNPLFIPLLLGLGLKTFSCAPRYLPLIKHVIRKFTLAEAHALAEKALALRTSTEISKLLFDTEKKWRA